MAVADLSSAAARSRRPEAPAAPEIIEADTAFLVYRRKDTGQIVLSNDLNAAVKADRQPTHNDVYMFLHVLLKDIVGEQYATMAAQMQLALQAQIQQAMGSIGGSDGLQEVLKNIRK